jgi:uncharacterized protein (TIGR02145 family)
MKKVVILATCLLAVAACQKYSPIQPDGGKEDTSAYDVRITPVFTKATETSFEEGDAIGVSISRTTGTFATNEKLVYQSGAFSGSLKWYAEGAQGSRISAYYPYSATVPTSFSVQTDQSQGTSTSDFIAGIKEDVLPSAYAVTLPFRHKLTRIVLNVTNNAGGEPASISLGGAKLGVKLDDTFTATVDPESATGAIKSWKQANNTYVLILPPQTVALVASVITAGGNELTQVLQETALAPGKQYTINMIVNPADLKVAFSGEIEGWEDGGEIGGDNTIIEKLSDGYILYHEDKYTVAKMKDGKWWMTQNLRYVPEGITVGDALTNVTAGVYYPVVVNSENTAAEFSKNIEVITARGYLYQAEVALGLKVGDLTTVAAAQALEGAQGLCPKGWHVPTSADIQNLVGKVAGLTTIESPYNPNKADCLIVDLNADGFNMDAFGAISIQDNTKTAGTFMGWAKGYPDKISSGMFCGSSYGGVTYNTKDEPDSGIKNLQFYGFMPMTNKATEAEYTCNGSKVSYRIAAPLRCVRNE